MFIWVHLAFYLHVFNATNNQFSPMLGHRSHPVTAGEISLRQHWSHGYETFRLAGGSTLQWCVGRDNDREDVRTEYRLRAMRCWAAGSCLCRPLNSSSSMTDTMSSSHSPKCARQRAAVHWSTQLASFTATRRISSAWQTPDKPRATPTDTRTSHNLTNDGCQPVSVCAYCCHGNK